MDDARREIGRDLERVSECIFPVVRVTFMTPIHAELLGKAKAAWLSVSLSDVPWPPTLCHLCATDNYPSTQFISICNRV